MIIKADELAELKQIYLRCYSVELTDNQAIELGTRLVGLFQVIAKPMPEVDNEVAPLHNQAR